MLINHWCGNEFAEMAANCSRFNRPLIDGRRNLNGRENSFPVDAMWNFMHLAKKEKRKLEIEMKK